MKRMAFWRRFGAVFAVLLVVLFSFPTQGFAAEAPQEALADEIEAGSEEPPEEPAEPVEEPPEPPPASPAVPQAQASGEVVDGVYQGSVTIALAAAPEHQVLYSLNGGAEAAYGGPLVLAQPGTYTIQFWAQDATGTRSAAGEWSGQVAQPAPPPEEPLPEEPTETPPETPEPAPETEEPPPETGETPPAAETEAPAAGEAEEEAVVGAQGDDEPGIVGTLSTPPTAPTGFSLDKTGYKGGDTMVLTFTAGESTAGTPREDLRYKLQYNYYLSWSDLVTFDTPQPLGSDGKITYPVTLPNDLNGNGRFRLYTIETDGTLSGSSNTISGIRLDSEAPVVTQAFSPSGFTTLPVEFTLTVRDLPEGVYTGLARVDNLDGAEVVNDNFTPGQQVNTLVYRTEDCGIFNFKLTDGVGNETLHTVTVDTIDRNPPDVTGQSNNLDGNEPGKSEGTHDDPVVLTLDYTDADATPTDAQSGVEKPLYVVTDTATVPDDDDPAWQNYSSPLQLQTKGTWYVHARAIDGAENESATRSYGPYTIHNTAPVAQDNAYTVYTKHMDSSQTNRIKVELSATDADGDALTYEVTKAPGAASKCTWTKDGSDPSGRSYWLEYIGTSRPIPAPFTIQFRADDGDVVNNKSNTGTITITVREVNTLPTAPAITAPAAGSAFKGGAAVTLRWNPGTDMETPQNELRYEVEAQIGSGPWENISEGFTLAGARSIVYTCPLAGTSSALRFRVRTVDGNDLASPPLEGDKPGVSQWAQSVDYVLDFEAPSFTVTAQSNGSNYTPPDPSNYPITLTFGFADAGGSGLQSRAYAITQSDEMPASFTTIGQDSMTQELVAVGKYYLHLKAADKAGNEHYQKYGLYDVFNTVPKALPQTLTVDEGASLPILLTAFDPDENDSITQFTIVTPPSYGNLVPVPAGSVGEYTYTHDGREGPWVDTFTFTATDSRGTTSEIATVTLNINPVNDPPELRGLNTSYTTLEGTALDIDFTTFDPDDLAVTLRLKAESDRPDLLPPAGISLQRTDSGNNGTMRLTLTPSEEGYTDSGQPIRLKLTLSDPHGETDEKTVEINITMVNQAPKAKDLYLAVPGTSAEGQVEATDRENDTLTYSTVSSPANGTLELTGTYDFANTGRFKYTLNSSHAGELADSFQVNISDGTNTTTITVHLSRNILLRHTEDVPLDATFEVGDWKNKPGSNYTVRSSDETMVRGQDCTFGAVSVADGTFRLAYAPQPDRFGTVELAVDRFEGGLQDSKTIYITIDAENDWPRTQPLALEGTLSKPAVQGKMAADDSVDGIYSAPSFTFDCKLLDKPEHGTLALNSSNGTFTYTPDAERLQELKAGSIAMIEDDFYITVLENVNPDPTNNPSPATVPEDVQKHPGACLSVRQKVAVRILPDPPVPPVPPGDGGTITPEGPTPPASEMTEETNTPSIIKRTPASPQSPSPAPSPETNLVVTTNRTARRTAAAALPAADAPPSAPKAGQRAPGPAPALEEAAPEVPAGAHDPSLDEVRDGPMVLSGWQQVAGISLSSLLLAALLLLGLLLATRVVVVFSWEEAGEYYEARLVRWLPRLPRKGEVRLDITHPGGPPLDRSEVSLHLGPLIRQRVYGKEIDLTFDSKGLRFKMPTRHDYHRKEGVQVPGELFTAQA